jgi:hypothetical protein
MIDKSGQTVMANLNDNISTVANGNFIAEGYEKKLLIDKNENVKAIRKQDQRPIEMIIYRIKYKTERMNKE